MSRPRVSLAPLRTLDSDKFSSNTKALTEEYEQTEQSITLALQEIDRNFIQANRIISEKIQPALEKYVEESRNIWAGGQFWKQFLESSAEVSLTAYEEDVVNDHGGSDREYLRQQESELANTEEALRNLDMEGDVNTDSRGAKNVKREKKEEDDDEDNEEEEQENQIFEGKNLDYKIHNSTFFQSTPAQKKPQASPNKSPSRIPRLNPSVLTSTTRLKPTIEDSPETLESYLSYDYPQTPVGRSGGVNNIGDGSVRHQVLDKNWRIQATPKPRSKQGNPDPKQKKEGLSFQTPETTAKYAFLEDSPQEPEVPQLNSGITFAPSPSVIKTRQKLPGYNSFQDKNFATPNRKTNNFYDYSDSDTDLMEGISPPVTMHFGVGNNKLIKTPTRKVAQTVVEDILQTMGGIEDSSALSQESYLNNRTFAGPNSPTSP